MNFDREDSQAPRITGLPEQEFSVPAQTFYAPETNESRFSNAQNQEVNPFNPPEYEQISNQENQVFENQPQESDSREQNFEEREIANWQAQDMIIGEKSKKWYVIFGVVVVIFVVAALILQMWTFAALIVVAAIAILVSRRDSHQNVISYSLSTRGVYIGNSFYPYGDFKYFGVLKEETVYSIVFVPKKRFAPSVSIYFSKEDGERITDIVGQRLPMEQIRHDLIDKIIRKINL